MKKTSLFLAAMALAMVTFCQENHVSWSYEAKKKTADVYDVIITAAVDHPWHLYSQQDKGPGRTSFIFKANPLITKVGPVKEIGNLEKINDTNLGEILSYTGKVQFVQTVKVKGAIKTNMSGMIQYVVCNDGRCLPLAKKSFDLKIQ